MKKLIITILLIMAISTGCDIVSVNVENPTKVYLTKRYLADYKIFITNYEYNADMTIEITPNRYDADFTAFIVQNRWEADKIVFIK